MTINSLNPIEKQLRDILKIDVQNLGYKILRIKFFENNNKTLQIMIEKHDNSSITVKDCAQVSRLCSKILDEKDPISDEYVLEVSSPGVDRPLMELDDFIRFKGSKAKIETSNDFLVHGKRIKGDIIDVEGDIIIFKKEKQENFIKIDFNKIVSAKLSIKI